MRIGVDSQVLATGTPSGHYYLILELLRGFRALNGRIQVSMFINNTPQWEEDASRLRSRAGDVGFPIRRYGVPERFDRLRRRLGATVPVDAFLYFAPTGFRPSEDCCNAFVLADAVPWKLPHYLKEGDVEWWEGYFDAARRHGEVLLTFSESASDDIAQVLGIPRDRLRAVPLAAGRQFRPIADRGAVAEHLRRWGLHEANYVLSVGTLEPRKNHRLILEAYERLRARRLLPPGCKLVFAGSRGWMYEPIFERIDELGLREQVVVLGHADPLECLYNGAAVMVYPSFMEGFGLPPLEAMACGTPVITSDTSSLPEVVGDAGIMVDPRDADGLAETMGRVLSDPAERGRMRARGLERAAGFSWERTAAGYLDVLRQGHRDFKSGR